MFNGINYIQIVMQISSPLICRTLHYPKLKLGIHQATIAPTPSLPFLCQLPLLPVSMNWTTLNSSYSWNYKIIVFLCLPYFT